MIVLSLAFLVSSSRRESTTIDVIAGSSMQRLSTAEPTRPVAPVTMTFILVQYRWWKNSLMDSISMVRKLQPRDEVEMLKGCLELS